MEIAERTVNDVTILDLKGKMTLGEGDELLKDKINSLLSGGRRKLLLQSLGDTDVFVVRYDAQGDLVR